MFHAHAVGHAQEQIRRGFAAVLYKTPRRHRAAARAREDDRQVDVRVAVAVRVAAAIDDHRVVQNGMAVHVFRVGKFLQKF